jgi:CRISPR-associated protein Csm2
MEKRIKSFKTGLREYQIKEMVNDTQRLGKILATKLKTNQVRKFLDAVNRLKAQPEKEKDFEEIKSGVQLLRPQLAYAAARQKGAVDLQLVMEAAINQINEAEDFTRFVQLTESIIAYHKAAGGKD